MARCMLQRSTDNTCDDDGGSNGDNNGRPPQEISPWCKCSKCRHMEKAEERVCCKNRPCTTTTEVFHDICLNRNVLAVSILNRNDYMGDDIE